MTDDDTLCPECGEPVSPTATYCMHCYADLPWADDDEATAADWDGVSETADSTVDTAVTDETTVDGSTPVGSTVGQSSTGSSTGSGFSPKSTRDDDPSATTEHDAPLSAGETGRTGWGSEGDGAAEGWSGLAGKYGEVMDPESGTDKFLTAVVSLGGSIVIGLLLTVALLFVTESLLAFPAGFGGWLLAMTYLARQYSVPEAAGKALYGVAAVLLLFPLTAVGPVVQGGLADRVGTFLVILPFVAIPAAIAAAVGHALVSFAPERE